MSHVLEIKEKLSIVDVVGSYITLEKAGLNFKAKCPFHNEKTPSFLVSPDRNTYYCFGCGAKGDIISFVERFEGLDFMGALRILAERAGVELRREQGGERTEKEKLYLIMEHATLFFQRTLQSKPDAILYLKNRGLSDETIKSWRIGYAPVDWKQLFNHLREKGFSGDDVEKTGLIKRSEKVRGDFYDRFRGRIMFPIFDASGRVIAYSGRQFESDGTQAKYINSPETSLFEKSKVLYGYDRAKLQIRAQDFSLLVEGQMDLLMSHQAGITTAVASSGTALTLEQVTILHRLSRNLVIAYDGDDAGNAATKRGFEIALRQGMEVKIVTLPEGKDPADLIKEDSELFKKLLKGARHIIDTELERIVKIHKDKRELGKVINKDLLPYLANLDSTIEKSHFISLIALHTAIDENALWSDLERIQKLQASANVVSNREPVRLITESVNEKVPNKSKRQSVEEMLMGIIYWQEKLGTPVVDTLDIRQKISTIIGTDELVARESVMTPNKEGLIYQAEGLFGALPNLGKHSEELLAYLKEEVIKEKIANLQRSLKIKSGPPGREQELLEESDTLRKELRLVEEEKKTFHTQS